MNVKRFFGASSRSVLQLVREELGADAVILANKSAGEGVEILAVSQQDMSGLMAAPKAAATQLGPSRAPSPEMAKAAAMPAPKGHPMSLRAHVERSAAAATPAGSPAGGSSPVPRGLDAFSQLRPDRSTVSTVPSHQRFVDPAVGIIGSLGGCIFSFHTFHTSAKGIAS